MNWTIGNPLNYYVRDLRNDFLFFRSSSASRDSRIEWHKRRFDDDNLSSTNEKAKRIAKSSDGHSVDERFLSSNRQRTRADRRTWTIVVDFFFFCFISVAHSIGKVCICCAHRIASIVSVKSCVSYQTQCDSSNSNASTVLFHLRFDSEKQRWKKNRTNVVVRPTLSRNRVIWRVHFSLSFSLCVNSPSPVIVALHFSTCNYDLLKHGDAKRERKKNVSRRWQSLTTRRYDSWWIFCSCDIRSWQRQHRRHRQ